MRTGLIEQNQTKEKKNEKKNRSNKIRTPNNINLKVEKYYKWFQRNIKNNNQ